MNKTIYKACNIIKNAGATHVYIFGSRANGTHTESSDYDFGVKGLSPYLFFRTWSQLEKELGIKADLVDFDEQTDFFDMLEKVGEVQLVG